MMLDFAKKSNMQTIAEFVSSEKIDRLVEELDVDFAQGYLEKNQHLYLKFRYTSKC